MQPWGSTEHSGESLTKKHSYSLITKLVGKECMKNISFNMKATCSNQKQQLQYTVVKV